MQPIPQTPTLDCSRYVGRPFCDRTFDCWGLVREVYADVLGIDMPRISVDIRNLRALVAEFGAHAEIRTGFKEIQKFEHLAVVEFGFGSAHHVGIYVDDMGGRILHNHHDSGVVLDAPSRMRFPVLGIYTHV